MQVTEYEPDVRVAFRGVAGPLRPDGSYTFAPAEGGTTTAPVEIRRLTRLPRNAKVKRVYASPSPERVGVVAGNGTIGYRQAVTAGTRRFR